MNAIHARSRLDPHQATGSNEGRGAIASALLELGLVDIAQLHTLERDCSDDSQLLEAAIRANPRLLSSAEKVRAMAAGASYYDRLESMQQHACMSEQGVMARCASLNCAIVVGSDDRPIVVFSTFDDMLHYKIAGRAERRTDPIARALGNYPNLAVGSRDEISMVLGRRSSEAGEGDVSASQVWNSGSAESRDHAEQLEMARLLDHALLVGATDISLKPNRDGSYRILIRKFGLLIEPRTASVWTAAEAEPIISMLEAKSGANPKRTTYRGPRDGRISYRSSAGEAFLRLSFIPLNHRDDSRNLKSCSIRLLPVTEESISLDALSLPPEAVEAIDACVRMPSGMALVVGPMNSGKSTSLAAAMSRHFEIFGTTKKRFAVEDPIERYIPELTQAEVPDVMTNDSGLLVEDNERFNFVLSGTKRHDINAYVIGEVRDAETAHFCVNVSSSGHLALSSLHAKSAVLAFDILAKMVSADLRFQLAESMTLIVSQRLVPGLCSKCKKKSRPTVEEKKQWTLYMSMEGEDVALPGTIYRRGEGCNSCDGGLSGYRVVCEVLPFTRQVRDAAYGLLEGGSAARRAREEMAQLRTLTLAGCAARLLKQGEIELSTVVHL